MMEIDPNHLIDNYVRNLSKDKTAEMLKIQHKKQIENILKFRANSRTAQGNKLLQWIDASAAARERRDAQQFIDPNEAPAKRTRKR